MAGFSLLSTFSRLSLRTPVQLSIRTITSSQPLLFRATPCLCAEPLRKKKKMDASVIKHREDRRKKKMEKQIRRLEKNARQLKPIDEIEVPIVLLDEQKARTRQMVKLSAEDVEYRALLEKQWARQITQERMLDIRNIDRIVSSQTKALAALRQESEELYEHAIMPDLTMTSYFGKGPVATPPIKNYDSPDGDYVDVTKKWEN